MDGFVDFLRVAKRDQLAQGNFLGFLNVCIGRRLQIRQGEFISSGVTWRILAQGLKRVRWPKEAVIELGLDPKALPPRDRERFWYAAISQAGVGSPQAFEAGDRFAHRLAAAGYVVAARSQ